MKKEGNINEVQKPRLIKDLGYIFPKETSKAKVKFGIYECTFCGNEFKARSQHIKSGHTKSCGCIKSQRIKEANTKHSVWSNNIKLYTIYMGIKDRVLNPKHRNYKDYGGRGITLCDEWIKDIKSFYKWSMENGYEEHLTLDRIDNDGGYEPSNCRWTTKTIQCRNRRLGKNNTSGYKGVFYNKKLKKFQVRIGVNNCRIHLGTFDTAIEGAITYNNYIIENNLEGLILNEVER